MRKITTMPVRKFKAKDTPITAKWLSLSNISTRTILRDLVKSRTIAYLREAGPEESNSWSI